MPRELSSCFEPTVERNTAPDQFHRKVNMPTSYSYKCGVFRLLKRGRVTFHAILTSSMEHQHPEMYQISSAFIKYHIETINFSLFFETK